MDIYSLVLILIIILGIIKIFEQRENFDDCGQYGNNYPQCYDSGNCTIMIDLQGNAFCTNKKS